MQCSGNRKRIVGFWVVADVCGIRVGYVCVTVITGAVSVMNRPHRYACTSNHAPPRTQDELYEVVPHGGAHLCQNTVYMADAGVEFVGC